MNPGLLKHLSYAFLPILVFIVADEFFGVAWGMGVAIVFTFAEFVWNYRETGSPDAFILLDLLLISVLGGISLVSANDLFFKLKPALMQAVLAAFFGAAAWSRYPLIERMAGRYMKEIRFNRFQVEHMRRMCGRMTLLLLFHTGLIVWTALHSSRLVWAFVSGGLFYLLIGALMLWTWLEKRRAWGRGPRVDLIGADEQKVGELPEEMLPLSNGALHRAVHLHLLSGRGELYLSGSCGRRTPGTPANPASAAAEDPGGFDIPLVAHVLCGETVSEALIRALGGLPEDGAKPELLFKYQTGEREDNELVYAFYALARDGAWPWPGSAPAGEFVAFERIRAESATLALTGRLRREIAILEKIREEAKRDACGGRQPEAPQDPAGAAADAPAGVAPAPEPAPESRPKRPSRRDRKSTRG